MFKRLYFRVFVFALAITPTYVSAAATFARVDAPPPAYAGGEAGAEVAMPELFPTARTLQITLTMDASAADNAEVALSAGGGPRNLDTTRVILGYKRGKYFIRGNNLTEQYSVQDTGTASTTARELTVKVRLDPDGAPVRATFWADGKPLAFDGLDPKALLAWLDPREYDTLQITSRSGAANVSVSAAYFADGTLIITR
jgi:hypothetical protein